ncbi:WD repeat-containing protein 20 [Eurosta solidaginis]|uniref:WD repeat-containing protein 20 n=1 Tax=Eurosta solidaginis TaxID=178769 RepID=UPI0035315C94
MAAQLDPNVKDDLKTQFVTREGTYRLLTLSEYSRPNRVGYTSNQSSPQVRVSIVSLPNSQNLACSGNGGGTNNASIGPLNGNVNGTSLATSNSKGSGDGSVNGSNGSGTGTLINGQQQALAAAAYGVPAAMDARLGAGISMHTIINGGSDGSNGLASQIYGGDRICFNFGRELYVYAFRGVRKGAEMTKPIDKKFYKGTNPSCHDFNATSATPTGAPLLVGFTTGQIQLVSPQPEPRELRKLYNEERLIDKTKVTCLKWLPNSPNLFLASHASGNLYLYNEDLPCTPTAPNYQPFKMGDGYTILTCKSKSTRNPLYKWIFNTENCCINEFCFSPCGSNLAIVSQDGFLRVFHYDTMELLGIARSYFGGFLCVCWSPDGKYIVVGGEDDLVTVWSLHERRVVARGQGHRSWVSVVAFDPYTTSYTNWDGGDFSDDENQLNEYSVGREARFSADSAGNGFDFSPSCGGVGAHEKNSTPNHPRQRPHSASFRSDASSSTAIAPDKLAISYRLGSVSQDTQICLWDITEDVLRHPLSLRQRVNSVNLNDTSYMNGGIDADGVKLIRPIAIGNISGAFSPPQHASSPMKETAAPENNSNSSSSKFSTANCTISSQSSNANTPPDDICSAGAANVTNNSKANNLTKTNTVGSSIKFPNCISATKSDSIEGNIKDNVSTFTSTSGYNSKNSNSSAKSTDSNVSAFNSLTQRLSNFSFLSSGSDKKTTTTSISGSFDASQIAATHRTHRKGMSVLKSDNNQGNSNHNHQQYGGAGSSTSGNVGGIGGVVDFSSSSVIGGGGGILGNSTTTAHSFGSLKLGKSSTHSHSSSLSAASNAVVTSYDPMKLIGTPSCPRFDECPLLEPLICKKIAHERLSALIFREDCFLTACQDGFIYTWARPGYATQNMQHHLSPSQAAPPGGTVI